MTCDADPCSRRWLGYTWSAWMPLMAAHPLALAQLPSAPGLFRIRRTGSAGEMVWIGWAQGGVREEMERLSRQVHLGAQPYGAADSPANGLWRLRREERAAFEVSGAAVESVQDGPETARELRTLHASGLESRRRHAPRSS